MSLHFKAPRHQLESVLETAFTVNEITEIPELLQHIANQASTIINSGRAVVCYQDPASSHPTTVIANHQGPGEETDDRRLAEALCREAIPAAGQSAGQAWLAAIAQRANLPDPRNLLAAPLTRRDGSYSGAIVLTSQDDSRRFRDSDKDLLDQLALLASPALENLELRTQAFQRIRALEQTEEHYQVALDYSQTGTFEHQLDTNREIWSLPLRRLYGYDETIEPSYESWLARIHPDDRAEADRVVHDSLRRDSKGFSQEFRIMHPAKGPLWMHSQGRVIVNEAGQPVRVIGTVVNITDRKQVEELLTQRARQQATVAQLGRDALAGKDLQELMDRIALQVTELLGVEYCKILELLPGGEELLLRAGAGWRDGLVGTTTLSTRNGSQSGFTLRQKEPVIVTDLPGDGRFHAPWLLEEHGVVSGVTVVIHGEGQHPWGVLGVHTSQPAHFTPDDIFFVEAVANVLADAIVRTNWEARLEHARGALEARVRERTAQLQAANRELEAFAYSVSHDLRAPLRGMDGFSQVLLEDYGSELDETARGYLERIRGAAQRMGELIDDLLSLSQVSVGAVPRKTVDLSTSVSGLARELSDRDSSREVHFEVQPDVVAKADPKLVRIALENLLDNAWKFTSSAGQAVVSFGAFEEADRTVFFVRDNGIGFDMSNSARLFSPFQRLHPDVQFEGTGIGLATVQRVVHKHDGTIWAESEPGRGTTIFFTLDSAGGK
jgi:PAS domain S-box-containing protein